MKRDIVLILGGGGMMGVFTAGALEVIHQKYRDRIHSIYGTSAGADVGAFFISDQPHIPITFFKKYLTRKDFIRKNIFPYLFKVFCVRNREKSNIKDFINIDYVVETAQNSDCKINLKVFEKSPIQFFVKLINIKTGETEYISAKEDLFQKLKASSNCGPLSTQAVQIENENYIDGETISSDIDSELVKKLSDKKVIYIESSYRTCLSKILLYPLHLLAGFAIMKLYNVQLGKMHIQRLFLDHASIKHTPHLIHIKNHLNGSAFCTNQKKLQKIYEYGIHEAEKMLKNKLESLL